MTHLKSIVFAAALWLTAVAFAQTMPVRQAVPDPAAQAKALALIKTVFKNEYAKKAPADQAALARRLLAEAQATRDDPVNRCVLLDQACELAAAAGDAATAMSALDLQVRHTLMDVLEAKVKILLRCGSAAVTPGALEILSTHAADSMELAVVVDRFDWALPLAALAENAAAKSQKLALAASLQPRLQRCRALAEEFKQVVQARQKLQAAPDSEAHGVIARYYCLSQNLWDQGLEHAARSSDGPFKDLAARELARPADPLHQVALADAWWDYAATLPGPAAAAVRAHAQKWYPRSEAALTGLTLTRIRQRLADPSPAAATAPAAAPNPAALDLLKNLDPARDAVAGVWSLKDRTLRCQAQKNARLQLPFHPPEEYDLTVSFTRTSGDGPVVLLLVGKNEPFGLALETQGHWARFEKVAGKIAEGNPTKVPCTLLNDHRYTVKIELRRALVKASLDGQPLTEWKTDYSDVGRYLIWKLPDEKALGLGCSGSDIAFDRVELVEITGKAKPTR